LKKCILMFLALAFSLALVLPAFAEDPAQESKSAARPPVKTELVRLKYQRASQMIAVIRPFISREGDVRTAPDDKVLIINDFPENIAKAVATIQELDIKPADLLFTVQLVLGSEEPEKGVEPMPNDPIIKELRNLLKYKSYSLLDTSLLRALDTQDSEVRLGDKAEFELWIRPKVIRDEKASLIQTEIRLRRIVIAGMPPNVTSAKPEYITTNLIGTTLNVKPGEKTVVGVSKLDGTGKGLILILSGRIVD
jgi:hypothetical protein